LYHRIATRHLAACVASSQEAYAAVQRLPGSKERDKNEHLASQKGYPRDVPLQPTVHHGPHRRAEKGRGITRDLDIEEDWPAESGRMTS
jgi:hypothetical protein